jgi:hypothetical protein
VAVPLFIMLHGIGLGGAVTRSLPLIVSPSAASPIAT